MGRIRNKDYYWFQTSAMFGMLCSFLWVIPWRLNFVCWRCRTPCQFCLHRWCKQEEFFQNVST